jgi:uncharacterized membrane protein
VIKRNKEKRKTYKEWCCCYIVVVFQQQQLTTEKSKEKLLIPPFIILFSSIQILHFLFIFLVVAKNSQKISKKSK